MTKAHINGKNRLIFLLTLVIGIMVLIVASKYAFQRACSRREIHWPDLEIADEWQYKIITEAYKIKNEPNREITITASDGVKLVGHYFERKKNAPIIIFFHGLWSDSYVCGVPIYRITEEHKWNLLLVSLRAHGEAEEIFRHLVCWKDMTVVTGQIGWLLNLENRCRYILWGFPWVELPY